MANLQIKNMPDEVHAELRRRSQAADMSMRDYVLDLIESDQAQAGTDEWLADLRQRRESRGVLSGVSAAELIREGREEREARILDIAMESRREPG